MVQVPLPIAPGEILSGKYRIESVLGRGGMGVVLAATHLQLEQRVAIKFLVAGGSDPQMRERFAREARAASRIQSEHVARVLDVGVLDSGIPYTVMEYLAGEDLAMTLRGRGALPVAEAVSYILQACEALAEAHMAGIVHRDLKPANVFLARRADGSVAVKLLDFGISKVGTRGADGAITSGAMILGSPTYMPPEQIRSARDVDARGDLWSLGATLFELLVGWPPFRASTLPELCVRILEEPAPDLAGLMPHAPPGLNTVVHRCLAKEPSARFATVAELAAALEPFAPADGRLSVERVARIMSAERPSTAHGARMAGSNPEIDRLQDAKTMKSDAGIVVPTYELLRESGDAALGEDVARSVMSLDESRIREARSLRALLAVCAIVVTLGMVAAGIVVLRVGPTLYAGSARVPVSAPPPTANRDPTASAPAEPPPRLEQGPTLAVSAATTGSAPSVATPPHKVARPLGEALSAPSPRETKDRAKTPSERHLPTLLGTEGFGDRK